jgi:hypothetical protein
VDSRLVKTNTARPNPPRGQAGHGDAVDSRLAKTNTGGLPILGRALQIIGLILVPVAVAGNLAEIAHAPVALSLGESLLVSVIGISLFYLGWLLNNRGSRV